jgi:hypothetical protein
MLETITLFKLVMVLITSYSLYKVHSIENFLYEIPRACETKEYKEKHPDVCTLVKDTIKEEV